MRLFVTGRDSRNATRPDFFTFQPFLMFEKFKQIPADLMFDGNIPEASAAALAKMEVEEKSLSEWKAVRLGKITGSQFHRITRGKAGGWSDGAKSYMAELIFEWVTGEEAQEFSGNTATKWGDFYENEAIEHYTKKTGRKVKRGKFYKAKGFQGLVGCTPDGVGKRGLEVKCPYGPKAHINTLLSQKVPDEYKDQVFGHMLCTGRDRCDFVSYDPRFHKRPDLQMVVIEVEQNDFYMADLEERLRDFEADLIKNLEKLGINWKNKKK